LGSADVPVVVDDASDAIHLPRSIAMILREILANFAAGTPVSVVSTHAELTTQQAADLLNVSRPYLVKLLDEGDLAYRMVGTHRRVRTEDLLEYRHRQTLASKRAADDLTELSQDLDLY
jgi:excisionase family DNA binding protein